ncbi:MAG TPA: glycosyltransferase family 1 protein [Vicinamibacterales bacterium]|nr:glycosyltransferase family 1 protein [Vicinamibacterales bacterium]
MPHDRPLRVALDARCLNVEHLRGMGKSMYEFIRRTSASGAIEWHLLANRPDLSMHVPDETCHVQVFETPGYRLASWEQYSLPATARKLAADVLHAPASTAPWWQPVPTAVTVHDTIPWASDDNETWQPGFYRDRLLPWAFHRAAAVITVSNTSRRDILARWPALKPTLHVISPGVDERYLDAEPDREPIVIGDRVVSEPYLLYLGGADPRKRLMWALQAWWTGAGAAATMVVCGLEPEAHAHVLASVPRHLQERLILAPFISEDDMPRLYMRATAVLYPSLYEGFGMPVVEAQAVGTRVLFSDVGSLTELKGPGAVVLPVDDLPAWVRTIALIVQSRASSYGPDRIARAWARQYSWDAYTKRTLDVYGAIAESDHGAVAGHQLPNPLNR